jgi:mono/diheme cytochrome c family protein
MNKMPTLVSLALKVTVGCLILVTAWVTWDNWGRFSFSPDTRLHIEASNTPSPNTMADGEYLVRIGGCVACHTSNGGEPLAGGRRIDTPFGPVFSSNLTPSVTHGIGSWTLADFQTALRWGRSRDGRLLLPAFPYNHTSVFTPSDVQAMFTWLQSIKPVDVTTPAHQLTWPVGTQAVIAVWRSMYFSPTAFQANNQQSDTWNRGAYLVQSAGHCAACHGQRNALGSFPAVDDLTGGFLPSQMWVAPSLVDPTQTTLASSSNEDISRLLRAGQNISASVSGPMAEFVQHVGQHLSAQDGLAIAIYLKSRTEPSSHKPKIAQSTLASSTPAAQAAYTKHCATCHGDHGEGKAGRYPSLAGNPAVVLAQPDNLIQMALYGGYGPSTQDRPRPHGMPPYLFTLNNQQIADVLNHIRSQWGNQAPAVSPVQVDRVRAAAY